MAVARTFRKSRAIAGPQDCLPLYRADSKSHELTAPGDDGRATTTKKKAMQTGKSDAAEGQGGDAPSQLIDGRVKELNDWRGEMLARLRALIKEADPEVVETWTWRGVPVWEHAGIICTGETYKSVVKMTFAKGAALEDPAGLFNSSLDGNTRRAIDFHEGNKINEKAPEGVHPCRRDPEHILSRQEAGEDESITG